MKIVRQKQPLKIINYDSYISGEGLSGKIDARHGSLLPNTIRALICGPSNAGKSNLLLSLLFDENGIRFENVYIYSKSLYQPKYQYMEKILKATPGIGYFPYRENDDIISPAEARPNSVFIFDDVACDKQEKIREYFSMGRHKNIECLYLCQTYTRIPKHLIRDNANVIILFKQDELNLKHCYLDHVSSDMRIEKFRELCSDCWKERFEFFTIVKDYDTNSGRYRKNLDMYIVDI